MSKRIRRIALMLAVVMTFSFCFFSCKDDDDGEKMTWDNRGIEDEIPEDTDFNGYEFRIMHRNGEWIAFWDATGNIEGDTVNTVHRAVYERNRLVEDRLKCKLKFIAENGASLAETTNNFKRALEAEEYYDFFITTNNAIVSSRVNHMLCDLNEAEYVNNGQKWWWTQCIEELSVDGTTVNYLVGDMNIVNFTKMSAFYFNFELIEEKLRMKPQDFYDLVNNGLWTLDRVNSLASQCYSDINGNGEYDDADLYAFPWTGGEVDHQFIWSTKIADSIYERDNRGMVSIKMSGNNDIDRVTEAVKKLCRENEGVRQYNHMPAGTFDGKIIEEFASGKYVFLAQRLTAACSDHMREMKVDYGILPYPTIDEKDEYISEIQNSSTNVCVPIVAYNNLEMIDICIEALCSEAARHTTETFFTMALKGKYTNDVESANMVDIIYESAHKSFLIEYSSACLGITGVCSAAVSDKSDVAAKIAAKEGAEAALNNFIIEIKGKMQ